MSEIDIYLLHAVWQDKNRNYCHRVIHSQGTPESMCDSFFRERKEWADCPPDELGWMNNSSLVRVTLFKTASMDDKSWNTYLKKARKKREHHIEDTERAQDFATIRALVKKHGVNAMEVLSFAAESQ